MDNPVVHRPRNVGWQRAAGLLYGDWGTSKAYVIGLAFATSGYASMPIILAVCLLTALVALNYVIICKYFPDGGGVYSAARNQSRFLAVIGALLLMANFTVTAALSGWSAMSYFGVSKEFIMYASIGIVFFIGALNYFGPKHTGSLAVSLALPMVIVVLIIIGLSLPHLTMRNLQPSHQQFLVNWQAFVGVILALSGVEAIANLTGVMNLDPGSTLDKPRVASTARKAIWPVACEVVVGTSLLGWAMLSLPPAFGDVLRERRDDMLRFLAEHYGSLALGSTLAHWFGLAVGVVIAVLLISAVNTAISAMIGLAYMMARDGEMPRYFVRLNRHGVPWWPMGIAVVLPIVVLALFPDLEALAGLYAIGVVGAIAVNLGSCTFNRNLDLKWWERLIMAVTFLILAAVELTIAKTKPDALFFALCVLILGLGARFITHRWAGLRTVTVSKEVAAAVAPESVANFQVNLNPGRSILVSARGVTPVLGFAIEEARLRQATLYVLYVRELAVSLPGSLELPEAPRWQKNPQAAEIMYGMLEMGQKNGITVIPLYALSDNPAGTILDMAATLGVDMLFLGTPHRRNLAAILKGSVVTAVAKNLPENIQLIIHG